MVKGNWEWLLMGAPPSNLEKGTKTDCGPGHTRYHRKFHRVLLLQRHPADRNHCQASLEDAV